MDITTLLKKLETLEERIAALYQWYAKVFGDHRGAAEVFRQLSHEEIGHRDLVRFQIRLAIRNIKGYRDVNVDVDEIDEFLTRADEFMRDDPPDLNTAVQFAVEIESSAAEIHYRNAVKQSNPDMERLLNSLNQGDFAHADKLKALAARLDNPSS